MNSTLHPLLNYIKRLQTLINAPIMSLKLNLFLSNTSDNCYTMEKTRYLFCWRKTTYWRSFEWQTSAWRVQSCRALLWKYTFFIAKLIMETHFIEMCSRAKNVFSLFVFFQCFSLVTLLKGVVNTVTPTISASFSVHFLLACFFIFLSKKIGRFYLTCRHRSTTPPSILRVWCISSPPIDLEYEQQPIQLFPMNTLETFLIRCQVRQKKKRSLVRCGTWPPTLSHSICSFIMSSYGSWLCDPSCQWALWTWVTSSFFVDELFPLP